LDTTTRAIAEAKVKTDKVDARILAQLLAADFLPETWVADDQTRIRRRLVARRTHLVPCQATFARLTSSRSALSWALRFRQRM
jgi:hypothetical protein